MSFRVILKITWFVVTTVLESILIVQWYFCVDSSSDDGTSFLKSF